MPHRKPSLRLVRAYEVTDADEGFRVLVDRLWPRGLKKETLRLDQWRKDLAPSSGLRKWFHHDPGKWSEFEKKYREELEPRRSVISSLLSDAGGREILLIYAAKDKNHNHAVILRSFILETLS